MSGQHGYGRRDSGWQALALAGGGAVAITLLLAAVVAGVWMLGGGPAATTALNAPEPQTPTPRAISFAPTADDPATGPVEEEQLDGDPGLVIVSTPSLMTMTIDGQPGAERDPVLEAATASELQPLASGSWTTSSMGLVSADDQAVAEKWLTLASVPEPSFAVEAEIRVTGMLDAVCDQSFGIAGGSPESTLVFGGGVLFPCADDAPRARLTNVTQWQDGYNADDVMAEEEFDPGDEWRVYRFELRDGQLELLVDGESVVRAPADPGISPAATDTETGLWSQGVGVEVRKVAVYALPAA